MSTYVVKWESDVVYDLNLYIYHKLTAAFCGLLF
jgi:hypothetical protein